MFRQIPSWYVDGVAAAYFRIMSIRHLSVTKHVTQHALATDIVHIVTIVFVSYLSGKVAIVLIVSVVRGGHSNKLIIEEADWYVESLVLTFILEQLHQIATFYL
jgi:hypothetical protein